MLAQLPIVRSVRAQKRSRVTDSALLPNLDGCSVWARRARDIYTEHLADLGGETATSAAERSIIERASV